MKQFPAMDPQDFTVEGRGHLDAAADITLSSAGKRTPHRFSCLTCPPLTCPRPACLQVG